MSAEWLQNLKAGDEVVLGKHIGRVARINDNIIVVSHPYKPNLPPRVFRRSDGVEAIGSPSVTLQPATPDVVAAIDEEARRQEYIARLVRVGWKGVSTDKLARIVAILDEESGPVDVMGSIEAVAGEPGVGALLDAIVEADRGQLIDVMEEEGE